MRKPGRKAGTSRGFSLSKDYGLKGDVRVVFFVVLAVSLCGWPFPSLAQTSLEETGSLVDTVRRLERDINLLQRHIYQEQTDTSRNVPFSSETNTPDIANGGTALQPPRTSAGNIARIEQRFADLEEQLRRLTDTIERAGYRLGQVESRLRTVDEDVGMRLKTLEDQLQNHSLQAANPLSADAQSLNAPNPLSSDGALAVEAAGDGVLGQLRVPASPQPSGQDREGQTGEETVLSSLSPKEQYDLAVELLWGSDYAKAETALRSFMVSHPQSDLVSNAQYWLGETYYARKDYTQAAVIFAEGYKDYPESQKAPDFLLKLALSLSQINESDQACKTLSELVRSFPDAPPAIEKRATRERESLACPPS